MRTPSSAPPLRNIWQKRANGLGDAVRCARRHVGDEPFLLLLGDSLIQSAEPVARRLIDLYDHYNESVVLLEEVEMAKVERYGVVAGKPVMDDLYLVTDLVEKPRREEAPSNLSIAARYVFSPSIFEFLEKTPRGKNDEIQLTDAMRLMLKDSAMYGLLLKGRRHDIGNKLDFLKTNVVYGLEREDIGPEFREFIAEVARGFGG